jgi:hypothetical protein
MIHPMNPTLAEFVATATRERLRADRLPVDPAEVERYVQRMLSACLRTPARLGDHLLTLAFDWLLARSRERERAV